MGLLKEGFDTSLEADVNSLVRKAAEMLTERGAMVEDVSIPWHLNGLYINKENGPSEKVDDTIHVV